ncbi:uncharacterized protein EKO05_0010452 [Ascochyta rabiei]|uniref:Uncharacterized protein n=1 Tax=Didymella rabiei TaxID=5454 RepID=A0A163M2G6_DIDRA|nr:uncharacterized protein EKO05_0010452 [Ascochyta rabiei]KZM28341.1 hypothetical protein ST47_g515 [Ascochyta rabiei]UPX20212.1 hypothetical protein EKO05_0010452 [Ascochyta rabiei]
MPSLQKINAIFGLIGSGQVKEFFEHIADDVEWTVKGTYCPISGHYTSKQAFHDGTHALSSTWATPLKLVVQDIIHDGGNKAAVQLKAVDVECKNGLKFTNEYVWICHFDDRDMIVKLIAFMDTDLVTKAIEQNPS